MRRRLGPLGRKPGAPRPSPAVHGLAAPLGERADATVTRPDSRARREPARVRRGHLALGLLLVVDQELHALAVRLVAHNVRSLRRGLDARVVLAAADAHEPVLTPVLVPGVLDGPVLDALLLAPAHKEHRVLHLLPAVALLDRLQQLALVDALRVVHELVLDAHADGHRAAVVELRHHFPGVRLAVVPAHVAVLVSAETRGRALVLALVVAGPVRVVPRARGGHEPDVLAPARDEVREAALAALVVLGAVEREGDGEGDLRAGLDAVARAEHAHRRDGVAGPAVRLVHHRLQHPVRVRVVRAVRAAPVEVLRERRRFLRGRAERLPPSPARSPSSRGTPGAPAAA